MPIWVNFEPILDQIDFLGEIALYHFFQIKIIFRQTRDGLSFEEKKIKIRLSVLEIELKISKINRLTCVNWAFYFVVYRYVNSAS